MTERPLVAHIMSKLPSREHASLEACVAAVRDQLLRSKPGAWRKTPLFQLCQLFRSTKDPRQPKLSSHRLVGEHFGHFELESGKEDLNWAALMTTSGATKIPPQAC